MMKAFKKKYKKVVVFVKTKPHGTLLKIFAEIDKVIYDPNIPRNFTNVKTKQLTLGQFYALSLYDGFYQNGKQIPSKNMIERHCLLLGLDINEKFAKPIITEEDNKAVKQLFDELELKENKTVFISPYASSINDKYLSKNFWINLSDTLTKRGYDVIFNDHKKTYGNYKTVFLPPNQIIPFVNLCSNIIGLRSGLTDIFSACCQTKMTVIYAGCQGMIKRGRSNKLNKAFITYNDMDPYFNIIISCSLKEMYKNDKVKEIICNNKDELNKTLLADFNQNHH